MSTEPNDLIIYAAAFIFIIALIALAAWMLKGLTGGGGGGVSFLRGRDRRLGVLEAANMDARRKLVLIKRDDVEHLIMIGGPIDIVVETGIRRGPDAPGLRASVSEPTSITADSARDRITLSGNSEPGLSAIQTKDRYDKV